MKMYTALKQIVFNRSYCTNPAQIRFSGRYAAWPLCLAYLPNLSGQVVRPA